MRYVLASVLLVSCSGDAFTGRLEATGGSVSGGAPGAGGAASGGSPGTGGSRDASAPPPETGAPRDAAGDTPADAGGPHTRCPPSPPSPASSCSGTFDCAYGDDARVSCRTVHQCRNGKWLVSAKQCSPLKYCPDLAARPVSGAACTTKDDYCTYAVGDDCACVQGATLAWSCVPKPPPPCPRRAPNRGQPCDAPDAGADAGASCTYGVCGSSERVEAACEDGVWTWSTPLCESPTRAAAPRASGTRDPTAP